MLGPLPGALAALMYPLVTPLLPPLLPPLLHPLMHAAQPTYLQANTAIISNKGDDIVDDVEFGVGQAAFE